MYHVHTWYVWGQKRVSDLPELVLEIGVSYHIDAGNPIQVLCKSSQCSKPPSCLSSPLELVMKEGLLECLEVVGVDMVRPPCVLYTCMNFPRGKKN